MPTPCIRVFHKSKLLSSASAPHLRLQVRISLRMYLPRKVSRKSQQFIPADRGRSKNICGTFSLALEVSIHSHTLEMRRQPAHHRSQIISGNGGERHTGHRRMSGKEEIMRP